MLACVSADGTKDVLLVLWMPVTAFVGSVFCVKFVDHSLTKLINPGSINFETF